MNTETKHPRHYYGFRRLPAGPRVGDWIGLNCGDLVRERDGRHVGRVVAILSGTTVRVRWLDPACAWLSDLDLTNVVKAEGIDGP